MLQLLELAREGDASARELLFVRCRKYLGVVARAQVESWLQAKVDASDLVQETMLEVHRGMDGFAGRTEEEWLAWMRRVLTHNAVDFVRRYRGAAKRDVRHEVSLQHRPATGSGSFGIEPCDGEVSPSARAIGREDQFRLAEALADLPEDYREVIVLRNLQQLPFEDVATRLNRSRPAAQMLWMRAMRRLKEAMESPPA